MSGEGLRTWLASWPVGRLPAKSVPGPPLPVPAHTLASTPCLPLIKGAEIGKPRTLGFSVSDGD